MDSERREELKEKLFEMKEIKSQYLVNSLTAFQFMKVQSCYRTLYEGLLSYNLLSYKPTLREIINLCNFVNFTVLDLLRYLAERSSRAEDLSLVSYHSVLSLSNNAEIKKSDAIQNSDRDNGIYGWEFDYRGFLSLLFERFPELFWNNFGVACLNVKQLLKKLLDSDYRFLRRLDSGQWISFKEFIDNPDYRRGTVEDFISCWNYQVEEGEFDAQPLPLDTKEISALEHFKLKERLVQGEVLLDIVEIFEPISNRIVPLASLLFDWEKTYKRALEERTLKHLHIERQIALSCVIQSLLAVSNLTREKAISLVDNEIILCKKSIDATREGIAALLRGIPDKDSTRTLDDQLIFKNESLQAHQYLFIALKQNRPWLIEYFSS